MHGQVKKTLVKMFRNRREDQSIVEGDTVVPNSAGIFAPKPQQDSSIARNLINAAGVPSTATDKTETKQGSSPLAFSAEDESNCRGLFTFVAKGRDETGVVDIVALHGLNGHYSKTWSAPSIKGGQVNWLKDMLPDRLPNARIMSFGYDAKVQFSKSTAGISDFVEGLLCDLISCRKSHEEKIRPLIFICHSLGGIVFKQALVRARERDEFTDLLKCIRGVAFFGTPHSGSSSANFGKVLASILKVSTMGVNTNTAVVNDLRQNSRALYEITQSFVDRGKTLRILTFYETEKMGLSNTQIVAKSSAVLNLPNETLVPIDGNHSTICKFSDSATGKRSFERVCSLLEKMTSDLVKTGVSYPTNLSQDQQLECLRGFYHKNYESYRNRNPDHVAGTCEWFLRHPEFRKWRSKEASSLLWVSADPGCGKSVLAKFLVSFLRQEKNTRQLRPEFICHFFFKDDNEEQRSSLFALRALLHQIFSVDKTLLRHAYAVFESKGQAIFDDFDSLWDIFSGIAKDPLAPNLFIILDALDECEKTSQSQLLESLNKLYQEKALDKTPFLKTMLLSRPENVIKYSLSRNAAILRLRGEDQTSSISEDVELVIRSRISELGGHGLSHDLLSGLERTIVKNADRTFLWATLMIELLKEAASRGASLKDLEDLLSNDDIYAIYSKLLERSHGSSETKELLQLILAAARPLTLDELNVALTVTPQQVSFKELKFSLKSSIESHLKNACGHFIRVIRSEVFLIHQTAREFLLQQHEMERSNSFGIWHNRFSIDECHVAILQSCIYYLFLRIISTDAELEKESLTRYASSFWSHHLASLVNIQKGLAVFDVIVDIALRCRAGLLPRAQMWLLAHSLIMHLDNWRFCLVNDPGSPDGFHDEQGVNINVTDNAGRSPLHYASALGSPWLVTTLRQYGIDTSASDSEDDSIFGRETCSDFNIEEERTSPLDRPHLLYKRDGLTTRYRGLSLKTRISAP
ncbi:ankyrin repeat [Fusarium pseudocircinatum]|uniref:Ankyrin repeat n=1 Tax=Fusarium pseudocircinatum TaxID=56676 RepID=A0A8H5KEV5_9HYPO|nr:ankyrin repeat [Fusarium pseudocircinatum]